MPKRSRLYLEIYLVTRSRSQGKPGFVNGNVVTRFQRKQRRLRSNPVEGLSRCETVQEDGRR